MKESYRSSTIQRALDILALFKAHSALSFTDIQRHMGINKSTLFRVLATLEDNRYLRRNAMGLYELGWAVFILGNRISTEYQLKTVSTNHMKHLCERLDLTVHLGILEGRDVVIIEKAEPHRSIQMLSRIGAAVPAHCTGQGKTLLAFSDKETVKRVIESNGLERFTPNTICTPAALFEELEAIRRQGYAVDRSEHEKHIVCVAVPILDSAHQIAAALSVTGTVVDFPDADSISHAVALLHQVETRISKEMGYHLPAKEKT
jgi:DNA-binding IclR family transcriptional regulator